MLRSRLVGVLVALVVALLPAAPAVAVGGDWPDGVTADSVKAATVGAASVTAGQGHSCAITSSGAVYCWGSNSDGQLGDGRMATDSSTAVAVRGGSMGVAVQVDAGEEHTCALDYSGVVYCWGDNSSGQLGSGAGPDRATAVRVDALVGRTLVEVTTGANHSCAIDDEGAAWCWGANAAGQLGLGAGQTGGTPVPVRVSGATGLTDPVVDIAAGKDTTCAATADGVAWCWGSGEDGQLGTGGTADMDVPVRVSAAGALAGVRVRQLGVGKEQSCAVDANGRVACWGRTSVGTRLTPARVAGSRFLQVVAGDAHACALDRDAGARCWGTGDDGRLGDGGTGDEPDPVLVAQGARDPQAPLEDLDTGDRHTCALDSRGAAYCWGADDAGQLGNGASGPSRVPVLVLGLPRAPLPVTGVRVTARDGGLHVTWQPVGDFGSGDFVSYLAVTAGLESRCEVEQPAGTGCDLTGLDNGTPYDVTVLTYTSDGNALSDFVTATPAEAPPAGTPPVAPPHLAPVPGDAGGLPITGPGPIALVSIGFLLLGLGLTALLVRRA